MEKKESRRTESSLYIYTVCTVCVCLCVVYRRCRIITKETHRIRREVMAGGDVEKREPDTKRHARRVCRRERRTHTERDRERERER